MEKKEKVKLSRIEKEKLLHYFGKMKPEDLFGYRDKAMLLLMLNHNLDESLISKLDLRDYKEDSLLVPGHARSEQIRITLKLTEDRAIFSYLIERIRNEERYFPDNLCRALPRQEAIFIDHKGRRLTPGIVRGILKKYLDKQRNTRCPEP